MNYPYGLDQSYLEKNGNFMCFLRNFIGFKKETIPTGIMKITKE